MSVITSSPPVTPHDLLAMPDAVKYELVDGRLVERNMGMESSEIALRIAVLIAMFLRARPIGHLFGADASYQCFAHLPDKVRKPDVSFIRSGRLLGEKAPKGHCSIAPDLAVEVISPGDSAYEVEEKVAEYLAAGVSLVWVVHPPTRTIRIHRAGSSSRSNVSQLAENDTIDGEDVLPGFSARVAECFG